MGIKYGILGALHIELAIPYHTYHTILMGHIMLTTPYLWDLLNCLMLVNYLVFYVLTWGPTTRYDCGVNFPKSFTCES